MTFATTVHPVTTVTSKGPIDIAQPGYTPAESGYYCVSFRSENNRALRMKQEPKTAENQPVDPPSGPRAILSFHFPNVAGLEVCFPGASPQTPTQDGFDTLLQIARRRILQAIAASCRCTGVDAMPLALSGNSIGWLLGRNKFVSCVIRADCP